MKHLYEDKKSVIHACESGDMGVRNEITLVWTKCGKDVPANKSFKSNETVTCGKCIN